MLITGANSYVGTNVEKWLMREPDKFYVETLDMQNPNWRDFDFSKFDVVFHVAGIAHVSTKKSMKNLYFQVNRDLTIETAKKSKESGVRQFIFMSSMIVYNSKETRITQNTMPNPDNFYGQSKLQAEEGIQTLQSDVFNVVILRPPMVYGPESKGNFKNLVKLSKYFLIYIDTHNIKSLLFIDNLVIYIENLILRNLAGIYLISNNEMVSTYTILKTIRLTKGKKTFSIYIPFWFSKILCKLKIFRKIYGDRYYDIEKGFNLKLISFEKTIEVTLNGKL